METQGVTLGYVGDKIRYILIIRVRLTSEFFFEHGFIGFNGCFARWEVLSSSQIHHLCH